MNNSDFLSEAVALDLGKSGVKVAETLEIEVGEEWWRLINAADVMDAKVFQKRRYSDPVIIGGEIKLDGHTEYRGTAFPPYTYQSSVPPIQQKLVSIGKDAEGGLIYGIVGQFTGTPGVFGGNANPFNTGGNPIFRVFNASGNQIGIDLRITTSSFYPLQWMFWDSVNTRFIVITKSASTNTTTVFVGAADASSFAYAGVATPAVWSFHNLGIFLEDAVSEYVYSLYLSGGTFYFKKTKITTGVAATSLAQSVVAPTDSIALTSIENHEGSAYLFYSRAFESVGVMWRDSVNGMRFCLESESFGTIHALTDVAGSNNREIFAFGNFVVPNEGEFLVAGVTETHQGVVAKSEGFSYPANFSLIGAAEVSKNKGVLIGKVGLSIYHIEIDLNTKTITDVFSVALPVEANKILRLLYASTTHEIWVEHSLFVDNATNNQIMFFCLDISNKTLKWQYPLSEWNNKTLWGNLFSFTMSTVISRIGMDKILLRNGYRSSSRTDYFAYFIIPITTLLSCNSLAEVRTALLDSGRENVTPTRQAGAGSLAYWHGNIVRSGILYDDAFNYILHAAGAITLQTFNATDKLVLPLNHYTTGDIPPYASSNDYPYAMIADQRYLAPGLHATCGTPHDGEDGMVVIYSNRHCYGSSSPYYFTSGWQIRQITPTSVEAIGLAIGGPTSNTTSKNFPDTIPLHHDPKARIGFFYYGDTIAIDGCHHDSNECAGYYQRVTVPFTTNIGMACPISMRYIVFSAVSDGNISWAEVDGKCGQHRKYYAYKSTDTSDVYEVKGLDVTGGYNVINFQGRVITGVTGVGRMALLDLEASENEGYSGGGDGAVEGNMIIEYLSKNFTPYPFAREGIRAELSNISKTTKITLPETRTNLIRGLLASGTDFRGSRCILRRIFPDHADTTGSDIVLLDGYIQDWSYVPGKKGIAFTVSKTLIDVGAQFPKRLMNMGCSHVFKGARCKYLGETGRCLKTKAFCQFLNNQNQFGGFPWVAARQRRVMWR